MKYKKPNKINFLFFSEHWPFFCLLVYLYRLSLSSRSSTSASSTRRMPLKEGTYIRNLSCTINQFEVAHLHKRLPTSRMGRQKSCKRSKLWVVKHTRWYLLCLKSISFPKELCIQPSRCHSCRELKGSWLQQAFGCSSVRIVSMRLL